MKVKKIAKLLPPWETITIWGNDEHKYVWRGVVEDIPHKLMNEKLIKGEDSCYLDIRYGCCDCKDHVAVFIDKEV